MRAPLFITALALASSLSGLAAAEQTMGGERISGTVKSASPQAIVIETASGAVDLALTPQTRILTREAAKADEIKEGAYLGTANQNDASGASGTSTEVHLMANGPNVNAPMNDSGLMMTNGHVKSVRKTAKGQEMDVDYGQGTARHVIVPAGTPTTRMIDVSAAALKPGETVSALAKPGPDGKLTAAFITVGAAPK